MMNVTASAIEIEMLAGDDPMWFYLVMTMAAVPTSHCLRDGVLVRLRARTRSET